MSNNFEYIRPQGSKNTPAPLHIGQSAGGWRFQFRAHPELGIMSFHDWKAFLAREPGHIEDECSRIFSLDEFIQYVDCRQDEPAKRRQERWTSDNVQDAKSKGWLDAEGYTFANYEFS